VRSAAICGSTGSVIRCPDAAKKLLRAMTASTRVMHQAPNRASSDQPACTRKVFPFPHPEHDRGKWQTWPRRSCDETNEIGGRPEAMTPYCGALQDACKAEPVKSPSMQRKRGDLPKSNGRLARKHNSRDGLAA